MKSVYQIARELVDAWPYSVGVKSAYKSMLVAMIAKALSEQRARGYTECARGYTAGHEATMKEETK